MTLSKKVASSAGEAAGKGAFHLTWFALLCLMLALWLPRLLIYDLPNLNQPWRLWSQGPSGAVAFAGDHPNHRYPTYIATADGHFYRLRAGTWVRVDRVPEGSQQGLASSRAPRPLIPYTLVRPPGQLVDRYTSVTFAGSLLDHMPWHLALLADGSIWSWTPRLPDSALPFLDRVAAIYAGTTLLAILGLWRLKPAWTRTWWVGHMGRATRRTRLWRTVLSVLVTLVLGAVGVGLIGLGWYGLLVFYFD